MFYIPFRGCKVVFYVSYYRRLQVAKLSMINLINIQKQENLSEIPEEWISPWFVFLSFIYILPYSFFM